MKMKWIFRMTAVSILIVLAILGLAQQRPVFAANQTNAAWTQIALPAGCPDWTRLDAGYYAITSKAYILGGRSGISTASTLGNIYAFDPVTKSCTDTGKVMPTPISNYTVALLNDGTKDLLCAFGGRTTTGTPTLEVQCYDPIANDVSVVTQLPSDYTDYFPGGLAVVNNKAYIFGGFNNYVTTKPYHVAYTYEYDPVANTFTKKGDINLARGYIDVAVVDGKIYGFGGDIWDGDTLTVLTLAEVYDPAVGTWDDAAVADLPTASGEGRAFGFNSNSGYELFGKIVITGGGVNIGGNFPGDTTEVFTYDVASNTYDTAFANLNDDRRNQAGFFVPGNPGVMWVFGGGKENSPPYAPPEYYQVAAAPNIDVTPKSINTSLKPGATKTVTLTVLNKGLVDLNWSAETPLVDWFSVTPTSGMILPGGSTSVDVTFDATGKIPADYTSNLYIDSDDPDSPKVTIPLKMTVGLNSIYLPFVAK